MGKLEIQFYEMPSDWPLRPDVRERLQKRREERLGQLTRPKIKIGCDT